LQQILLDTCAIGGRNGEADITAQRTKVDYMRQQTLQLEPDEANGVGALGHMNSKYLFKRHAVGNCVRKAVISRN
jgi:hypothetical protein